MRIAKVHIERYRSIYDLTFTPGPYCVLIGENNAGKSNILRALSLALGDAWPSERSFSDEDFYNQDTTNDVVVQVYFDKPVEEWRNNFRLEVAGLELRCKAYKKKVKDKPAGTLKVDYTCIDANGAALRFPPERLQKGKQPKGVWLPLRVTGEIRERIPFIYVDVLRDYGRQSPGTRWSILRRLFNEVNTKFLNDKTAVTFEMPDGSKKKVTRREAFELAVKDAYKYLRTEDFLDIERRLADNAIEQMGLDENDSRVELHFDSHDPTNAFKSLQLYVEQMGITSPAGEVGAGLQSAIVVAIFRTYEELKKGGAVFAIEEPEVFLHPQKARYFETVLRKLADGGNQIFLTTHSPIFVQIHQPESVALVRRAKNEGTRVQNVTHVELSLSERQTLRLLSEFNADRNELFFARAVMLVEGVTEKIALPLAFRAMGKDLNRMGVSIVEVGGKTKFPLFVRVLNALRIPYVVLADHDIRTIHEEWGDERKKREKQRNEKHTSWNKDIEAVCVSGSLFWLRPDFEGELKLPREESDKLDQAVGRFQSASTSEIPDCLKKPMDALLERL